MQFIATTNALAFDPTLLTQVVGDMNAFFASGRLSFAYDPLRDFVVMDDALLDQDWELIDAGSLANPETIPPAVDDKRFLAQRQRVASQYLGKLVVYVSRGSFLFFQAGAGWTVGERGFHYSSAQAQFVATAATYWRSLGGSIDPNTLAHEIGHYLHQIHTMNWMPKTVADAADALRVTVDQWGWNQNDAALVFDADRPFIEDTPPDPGPDLFLAANGAACGGQDFVEVPVTFASGNSRTYRPDFGWNVVGTKRFGGAAVVVSWGPGRLDVLARDADGSLWWIARIASTWVGSWQSLGGSCVGVPAVTSSLHIVPDAEPAPDGHWQFPSDQRRLGGWWRRLCCPELRDGRVQIFHSVGCARLRARGTHRTGRNDAGVVAEGSVAHTTWPCGRSSSSTSKCLAVKVRCRDRPRQ